MVTLNLQCEPRRLWVDLGDFGALTNPNDPSTEWHDHGLGLLRTILHAKGLKTDLASTRACNSWPEMEAGLRGYDVLLMNVRSYTFPMAFRVAKLFKALNPQGLVLVGGMHATVALNEMTAIAEFDKICQGPGENTIVDLVRDPASFPRVFKGKAAASMAEWPMIDRRLWPRPPTALPPGTFSVGFGGAAPSPAPGQPSYWPLEGSGGWFTPPVATVITSRVCPWQCSFCNEASFIPNMGRRPVEMVIEELNYLDSTYGPLGSVVLHDSMFFQNPSWLKEWLHKYPKRAHQTWPYWAAGRADTVRKWPELFEALIRETNWQAVSIGFESGSDRVLKTLNKECTAEDNRFTIELLNRIGDDIERAGKSPPFFWANVMFGIPGETREDALETMRMTRFMRRKIVQCAHYSPYPGSILGHQLIAENKSLMSQENYHRYAGQEKVQGIDYPFYADLVAGKFNDEVLGQKWGPLRRAEANQPPAAKVHAPHQIFLFKLTNGKKKLAYGQSPADALETLRLRLSEEEMSAIVKDDFIKVSQRDLRQHIDSLG